MCVAIVLPEGAERPTIQQLKDMESSNPDGAGVGWSENGRAHWLKGLVADEVDSLLDTLPRPVLIHFRYATAGDNSAGLCHPFSVDSRASTDIRGHAQRILIHNGHWTYWNRYVKRAEKLARRRHQALPSGEWSDTRLAAYLLSAWPNIADKVGGKLAFLDGRGTVEMYGDWVEYKGGHYSNMYWRRSSFWSPMLGRHYADMLDWQADYDEYEKWRESGGYASASSWREWRDAKARGEDVGDAPKPYSTTAYKPYSGSNRGVYQTQLYDESGEYRTTPTAVPRDEMYPIGFDEETGCSVKFSIEPGEGPTGYRVVDADELELAREYATAAMARTEAELEELERGEEVEAAEARAFAEHAMVQDALRALNERDRDRSRETRIAESAGLSWEEWTRRRYARE